ncbi:MAG: hypothetical protein HYX52_06245 [Chloroflexi bacterium]|nr:hypothetical protein [Chloroflexota bacterium]
MATFPLERFEATAEAFLKARTGRAWAFATGAAPGRSLRTLYERDFPDFLSRDLWDDLADAPIEEPRRKQRLQALLLSAQVEGRTAEAAARASRLESSATIILEEQREAPWRSAPFRWSRENAASERHTLEHAWRTTLSGEINPVLERWQDGLSLAVSDLGLPSWMDAWSAAQSVDLAAVDRLADQTLSLGGDLYGSALGVYLAQLSLPLDDAWWADLAWACGAPRIPTPFHDGGVMPVTVRTFRDLGFDIDEQLQLRLERVDGLQNGAVNLCASIDPPEDVRLGLAPRGGWRDSASMLGLLGEAQAWAHLDPSMPFWERRLGDETTVRASGLLFEGLVRERDFLAERLEWPESHDFRIVATLAWCARTRRLAAEWQHLRRLWADPAAGGLAADYADGMSAALRVRTFPDTRLLMLLDAPRRPLGAASELRAEVFAAHLRRFLRREFDEDWWRNPRAGRFLLDEVWRPGRRHGAEDLLGFMGSEGLEAGLLWDEQRAVLAAV